MHNAHFVGSKTPSEPFIIPTEAKEVSLIIFSEGYLALDL